MSTIDFPGAVGGIYTAIDENGQAISAESCNLQESVGSWTPAGAESVSIVPDPYPGQLPWGINCAEVVIPAFGAGVEVEPVALHLPFGFSVYMATPDDLGLADGLQLGIQQYDVGDSRIDWTQVNVRPDPGVWALAAASPALLPDQTYYRLLIQRAAPSFTSTQTMYFAMYTIRPDLSETFQPAFGVASAVDAINPPSVPLDVSLPKITIGDDVTPANMTAYKRSDGAGNVLTELLPQDVAKGGAT